ncbi:hypothetical protein AG1IA_09145 [Rhizoctonia solani AG-1 IA]|uniref:Uncharacterized protein n=1 Tax=Thanatephorus cucumeris (strain AG1-IA) TaxID=983506 RepID=L8WKF1_THACA|nr:hypothetical protein AG1IA_09145 [Rhizoctonia solani AG-1 IA]
MSVSLMSKLSGPSKVNKVPERVVKFPKMLRPRSRSSKSTEGGGKGERSW